MILAVDIGNTNIVIGAIDEGEILFIERISTNRTKTELEYALDLNTIIDIHRINKSLITGGIISSVVPQLTGILKLAVIKVYHFVPLEVGPGIKTGLNIRLDNPAEIGADRVADAVAAISDYPTPLILIDMGTANTFSVIDKNKNFIGGLILPGIIVSLEALTSRAAQLNGISLEKPKDIIGRNTRDCMKSGVVYGNASMVDGLIDRIEERLESKAAIVATGGLSNLIVPYCKHEIIRDENLLLKGLWIIYNKNVQKQAE